MARRPALEGRPRAAPQVEALAAVHRRRGVPRAWAGRRTRHRLASATSVRCNAPGTRCKTAEATASGRSQRRVPSKLASPESASAPVRQGLRGVPPRPMASSRAMRAAIGGRRSLAEIRHASTVSAGVRARRTARSARRTRACRPAARMAPGPPPLLARTKSVSTVPARVRAPRAARSARRTMACRRVHPTARGAVRLLVAAAERARLGSAQARVLRAKPSVPATRFKTVARMEVGELQRHARAKPA